MFSFVSTKQIAVINVQCFLMCMCLLRSLSWIYCSSQMIDWMIRYCSFVCSSFIHSRLIYILDRIAGTASCARCGLFIRIRHGWDCKNAWTDRETVWGGADSYGPKGPIRWITYGRHLANTIEQSVLGRVCYYDFRVVAAVYTLLTQ